MERPSVRMQYPTDNCAALEPLEENILTSQLYGLGPQACAIQEERRTTILGVSEEIRLAQCFCMDPSTRKVGQRPSSPGLPALRDRVKRQDRRVRCGLQEVGMEDPSGTQFVVRIAVGLG